MPKLLRLGWRRPGQNAVPAPTATVVPPPSPEYLPDPRLAEVVVLLRDVRSDIAPKTRAALADALEALLWGDEPTGGVNLDPHMGGDTYHIGVTLPERAARHLWHWLVRVRPHPEVYSLGRVSRAGSYSRRARQRGRVPKHPSYGFVIQLPLYKESPTAA